MPAHVGTVKYFDEQKGFGMIVPEGSSGGDVIVHKSGIADIVSINGVHRKAELTAL